MNLFQMDFFLWVLSLMLAVGAFFIIYAIAKKDVSSDRTDEQHINFLEKSLEQKLSNLGSSVNQADETLDQLEGMSKNMLKEFDDKYSELLFLYNLIDEKQKMMSNNDNHIANNLDIKSEHIAIDYIVGDKTILSKKISANPKIAKVIDLHKKGMDIEEIAQIMDMGKGEINLIFNLQGVGRRHNA